MFLFAAFVVGWMAEPVVFVRAPLKLQPRYLQVASIPSVPPLKPTPAILTMTVMPPVGNPYQATLVWTQHPGPTVPAGQIVGTWQGFGPNGKKIIYSAYDPNQLFRNPGAINPANQLRAILHGAGYIQVNSDNPYSAGPVTLNGYTISVAP